MNEYDRYIANKIINGNQCTIVWYVDDGDGGLGFCLQQRALSCCVTIYIDIEINK